VTIAHIIVETYHTTIKTVR